MTALFKEKTVIALLATEIKNNFTQQQKEKLHFIIGTSDIVNYAGIKLLAKNIKNYLVEEAYSIKHGQVLNILAKSYGFSNHHSMTASFEKSKQTFEGTSNLSKIFRVREELFELFDKLGIEFRVFCFIDNGLEFDLEYNLKNIPKAPKQIYHHLEHFKKYKSLAYQAKLSVNKLIRHYGIKPYKNDIRLIKLYNTRGVDTYSFRNEIVKAYHSFFEPMFIENKMTEKSGLFFVAYKDIYNINDDLYVDKYYTDNPWAVTEKFLVFLVKYGEIEDYQFVESLLSRETTLPDIRRDTLSKQLLLKKYEKFRFFENFMGVYRDGSGQSLRSILNELSIVIHLPKEKMNMLDEYANEVKDILSYSRVMNNLSDLIIECCVEFYADDNRYNEIEQKLYCDFLHYEYDKYMQTVKNDTINTDTIFISYLAEVVEVMCQRIETIIQDNDLILEV